MPLQFSKITFFIICIASIVFIGCDQKNSDLTSVSKVDQAATTDHGSQQGDNDDMDGKSHDDDDQKDLAIDKLEGDFSVVVLGSGGPVATPGGRAGAGYLIFTNKTPRVLMDVGGGTYQRLAKSGATVPNLDIFLLSHLHIDHTADMSAVVKTIFFHNRGAQIQRPASLPIRVYGPSANGSPFPAAPFPNVPEANTIAQYPAASDYVHSHYNLKTGTERYLNIFSLAIEAGRFSYEAHDVDSSWMEKDGMPVEVITILQDEDGLVIKAIGVDHGPVPALGFRVEYNGRSVVYSGDTGSKNDNMIALSMGADVLIYDTAVMQDAPALPLFHVLHTEPARLGQIATAAEVKMLVLSHITPVTEPRLQEVIDIVRAQGFTGVIKVAHDLDVYNVEHSEDTM